jgi:sucrose-6F-phosphate phosphohydrolase
MTVKLLSFDIDGTIICNQSGSSVFSRAWQKIKDQPVLCYNTGRMLDDMLRLLREKEIPQPAYIISGVGTTIYDVQQQSILQIFNEILEIGWNAAVVDPVIQDLAFPIEKQPDYLQSEYKSSWFFDNASPEQLHQIRSALTNAGLNFHLVYSNQHHLDILPKWANKGNALFWLMRHLNIQAEETLVAGDTGNDNAMFLIEGIKGIIVGNAQPELYQATKHLPVYHAESECGAGVVEGLIHFGIAESALLESGSINSEEQSQMQPLVLVEKEAYEDLEPKQLELIHEAYQRAIIAIKKNITPLGFSACSLDDNSVYGTDENYRSVWARDGAITIIGSLPLIDDPEIKHAQIQTFKTILAHIAPNGQPPSNVRIDTKRPDYSGVGGICSVDSALWFVIAFHEYIQKTRDLDFLRTHLPKLQRMMNWLSALDSNNDALLEIPEAGDWTDLLGYHYNILYDEILWFQSNICFGRMLGWLGEDDRAGDYLRWSRVIKKEILLNFWPSTQSGMYQTVNFAEQQYSLGDTHYLIAQVGPFDFSWRCDVFGNILAFLYNVVDAEKAKRSFKFMWGVGINEPYPVTNLYPAIHVGDRDWQPYYVVNLLNLPNQYHNGGVWPFIGAQWVRFIHKLGFSELAYQELYKVAQLNKLGVENEWEFNEWVHGKTGRPMGKAYQAWSASEFILACHDLNIIG